MSPFKTRVITVVKQIPYGLVASYGQVALLVGVPRGARQVGWILNSTEGQMDIPWWRVLNNKGVISIKGTKYNDKPLQKKLLEAEGIKVSDNFELDMKKYRFIPDRGFIKQLQLKDKYIAMLIEKYGL